MDAVRARVVKSPVAAAFTLVELSIVLVIIGLIVGGILVGRDLISAAGVRAQISQIEKYQTAVNTFQNKYGYLPGDISDPTATRYGFTSRGTLAGQGDGNGVIEGYAYSYSNGGFWEAAGETVMFWVDLSTAGLIEGGFSTATPDDAPVTIPETALGAYFPPAKIGRGNYIYVYSINDVNYYGISYVGFVGYSRAIQSSSASGIRALSVAEAYSIDNKIDDGYPQTGNVTAQYLDGGDPYLEWAGSGWGYLHWFGPPPGTAAKGSAASCFDNGDNASAIMQYSLSQANGSYLNCALSLAFQ